MSSWNLSAIRFYRNIGFRLLGKYDLASYMVNRGKKAAQIDNLFEEADGTQFYALRLDLPL